MAEQPPQSRPEPPRKPRRASPQSKEALYGGQWGSSGKQKPADESGVEPPKAPPAPRK